MADERLKSAYELALERFRTKDAEAGVVQKPLSDEQRARIADVRALYQAKLAELEILHQGRVRTLADPAAREAAEDEYRRDRDRVTRERDAAIDAARS